MDWYHPHLKSGLPASMNSVQKLLHSHTQMFVSMVILKLTRLTHHTYTPGWGEDKRLLLALVSSSSVITGVTLDSLTDQSHILK